MYVDYDSPAVGGHSSTNNTQLADSKGGGHSRRSNIHVTAASPQKPAAPTGMAKAVFDVRAYVLRFFASWVGIILLLRSLDYHVLPSDEAVLQPAWASCIQHVPWLASHAGFPGLVGAVAFVISCLCFSVLDLRRSVSTKLQKHYFPSLWDMLKAGGPQVVLYGAGNWAGYAFGYHEIALPERAPRICIFAEEVLICFIVGDFFIYAEHRLMHAVAADSQTLAH